MNKKTKKALEEAIKKYSDYVEILKKNHRRKITLFDLEIVLGPDNCSLCKLFKSVCDKGCPVYGKTGFYGCHFTPYQTIRSAYQMSTVTKSTIKAFQDELNFLISLRSDK